MEKVKKKKKSKGVRISEAINIGEALLPLGLK